MNKEIKDDSLEFEEKDPVIWDLVRGTYEEDPKSGKRTFDQSALANNLNQYLHLCSIDGELYVKDNLGSFAPFDNASGKGFKADKLLHMINGQWPSNFRREIITKMRLSELMEVEMKASKNYILTNSGALHVTKEGVELVCDRYEYAKTPFGETLFLDSPLDVTYDPEAKSFVWDTFLKQITGGDDEKIKQLQQLAGQMIMNKVLPIYAKTYILVGDGANGKSVFLDAITNVIGRKNISSTSLRSLTNDKFASYALKGKLVNIGADIDAKYLETSSTFKALVTRDEVILQKKGGQPFSTHLNTMLVFATNELPMTADKSAGWLRRLMPISFDECFLGREDFDLPNKLRGEDIKSAIFKWALDGIILMLNGERLIVSNSSNAVMDEYQRENNHLVDYMDTITMDDVVNRSTTLVYNSYTSWCMSNAVRAPFSKGNLTRHIKKTYKQLDAKNCRVNGKIERQWVIANG